MSNLDFKNSIYCVITGASRGIGRSIAIETARRAQNKIVLVLIARSETNLNETRKLVLEANKNATVYIKSLDLSNPDVKEYEDVIKSTLVEFKDSFSAVMFHNAGHIGIVDKAVKIFDVKTWQDYYTLNLVSVVALNAVFVNNVRKLTQNLTVINITSLLGRKAFAFCAMYGSAKASRDLYFKVLAEEEKNIRVLNWSPGMVATDMANDVLSNFDILNGTNEKDAVFKTVLKPEETVNKMLDVIEKNAFESGAVIDYHDLD